MLHALCPMREVEIRYFGKGTGRCLRLFRRGGNQTDFGPEGNRKGAKSL